jgi:hypothetical protein
MIVMFQELKRRPTAIVESVVGSFEKHDSAGQINDVAILGPAQAVHAGKELR